MSTTEWVIVAMTVVNIGLHFATKRNYRDIAYYTAWGEVFDAMRAHVKAAPKDDLDAISRVYAALGDAFDRNKKS